MTESSFIDPEAEAKAEANAEDRKQRESLADELDSLAKLIGQKQQALAAKGINLNPQMMLQIQLQHLTDHLLPPMVDDHPTRPLPRSWERLQFEQSWARVVLQIIEQAEKESRGQQGIVIPDNGTVQDIAGKQNGNRAQRRRR